ncbi:LuxR C-terminal-related transcriptional regulator [Arthrobacter sp.]|uniref:LuxR C-terminal-related transcriptional regulator n=1 Tax=Arthrobacter sp. TaxID=1667 RepID=UPI00289E8DEA|nr:LuxR C-terminal-related transcriptional regulator [Arthrobacter sp.]
METQMGNTTSFLRAAEAEDIANQLLDPGLRGVVLLAPEGMGKSALAEEVLSRLDGIVTVYRIHGSPVLSRIPYGALTPFLDPALAEDLESPLVVLRNIRRYFRVRAEAGHPQALLMVDDAHHLDEASSHILVQLAMSGELRLMVLSRSRGVHMQELLSLARDGLMSRVDLQPLSLEAVHELCLQELGGPVLTASSAVLAQVSGGNPLYVKALIAGAQRRGELLRRNESWYLRALPGGLEPTAQDLAKRLLAGRTPLERTVLETVALAGALSRSVLAALADQGAVQALIDDGYLEPVTDFPEQLRMAQSLHADAVRSLVPPMRSIEIRQNLLGDGGAAEGIAQTPHHLAWALDCGDVPQDSALVQGARVANAVGDAELALRLALAVRPGVLSARARVEAAAAQLGLGNLSEAWAGVEDAVSTAPDTGTLDLAVLTTAQLAAGSEQAGDRIRTLIGAWAVRDAELTGGQSGGTGRAAWMAAGKSVLALWARVSDGDLLTVGESVAAAVSLLEAESLQAMEAESSVLHEFKALGFAAACEVRTAAGAGQEAVRAAHEAQNELLQEPLARSSVRGSVFLRRGLALLHCGRFEKLSQLLAGELQSNPHYLLAFGGTIGVLEGALEIHQGRFREGLRRLRPAIEALRAHDPERLLPYALAMAGYVAAVVDDTGPATRFAGELRGVAYSSPPALALTARAFAAAALAPQGSEEPPPSKVRELAAEARGLGQYAAEKDILELAMAIGDLKQARRLVDLTDSFEGGEAAALHAYAAAVAADNPERMVAAADEAVRRRKFLVAVECIGHAIRYYGAHNNLRRQRALIQQLRRRRDELAGVTVSYLSPSVHQVRLTKREHEIVKLLLDGASTKDIATRFTLSQRTVEGHVYRIYVKLGISRRTELEAVYRALEAEPRVPAGQ